MIQRSQGFAALAIVTACIGFIAAGCGGAAELAQARPSAAPPKALSVQPDSMLGSMLGVITSSYAIRGSIVLLGTDLDRQAAIWVGNHKFRVPAEMAQAVLTTANFDFAVGTTPGGSFLWPYRTNSAPILIPRESITAVAKGSNLFFDLAFNTSNGSETANLLVVKGNRVVRVPYTLPSVDFASKLILGIAVNDSGEAVLKVTPLGPVQGTRGQPNLDSLRSHVQSRLSLASGTPSERVAKLKVNSALASANEYFLISSKSAPVPLEVPFGVHGIIVTALSDKGIAVGAGVIGDAKSGSLVPYFWDARGRAHQLPTPSDSTFGIAQDVNSQGSVVGDLGNEITNYAVLWHTVASDPVNVNSLLSATSSFDIRFVDSIGNDFTMAANAVAKTNSDIAQVLGLQPN